MWFSFTDFVILRSESGLILVQRKASAASNMWLAVKPSFSSKTRVSLDDLGFQ
ncbi:hypothetical protein HanXRQr2_Chr16g0775801 [Helianthus annuus]|uniref:Uncharacterized protein n=1 Tax=Helianthus annuus TaxID=4232 RepID=A0A9K3H0V3_HELAN|nr:hypothetical protein HanXRQr2_Chr16g0775801 [Helianthus annuus]KAJ0823478.1 hypothetical protein HanPSC8_Chr16g0744201 [Helianthus annuus]